MAIVSKDNPWGRMAEDLPFIRFIDVCLRANGQVIYMDNPLTGLLNFVAIFWGAYVSGTPAVAWGSVVATLVGVGTAYLVDADKARLHMGLFVFSAVLVGCGIPTFLGSNVTMWIVLVLAAATSTVLSLAISNVFDTWGVPAFTFPFVLTTWLVMLGAYNFPNLVITGLPHAALTHAALATNGSLNPWQFVLACSTSVAQVWFINNPVSGAIFTVALFIESAWCGVLAIAGAVIGVACALLMGADVAAISNGLWGYSPVLTATAVGCIFMKPNGGTLLYALLATIVTVGVQSAMNTVCGGVFGVPAFTFPFVLTSWLFLLAHRRFGKEKQVA